VTARRSFFGERRPLSSELGVHLDQARKISPREALNRPPQDACRMQKLAQERVCQDAH
jgi:hypothetical protein